MCLFSKLVMIIEDHHAFTMSYCYLKKIFILFANICLKVELNCHGQLVQLFLATFMAS